MKNSPRGSDAEGGGRSPQTKRPKGAQGRAKSEPRSVAPPDEGGRTAQKEEKEKTMRYFLGLAYKGKAFCGYQRQVGQLSVQERIEDALQTLLRADCPIVGCGRTDTGVHARQYYAHFDSEQPLEEKKSFLPGLNALLGKEIYVYLLQRVADDAHARFDAVSRGYEYYLSSVKNPFRRDYQYQLQGAERLDWQQMQQAAQLLLDYSEFAPFCKTNTDTLGRACELRKSEWRQLSASTWVYEVEANRFLRGMIRLIVGASIYIGQGKMSLDELRRSMDAQIPLPQPFSAPGHGLFLTNIRYPYIAEHEAIEL